MFTAAVTTNPENLVTERGLSFLNVEQPEDQAVFSLISYQHPTSSSYSGTVRSIISSQSVRCIWASIKTIFCHSCYEGRFVLWRQSCTLPRRQSQTKKETEGRWHAFCGLLIHKALLKNVVLNIAGLVCFTAHSTLFYIPQQFCIWKLKWCTLWASFHPGILLAWKLRALHCTSHQLYNVGT